MAARKLKDKTIKTAPKPFVFVLMPFSSNFDDVYKFGMKGAAEDVGAHAERVDEQMYHEGILERIFNQINKADVIVADMTGRNANVFYEVGYAHALDKVVILLTQDAADIPFDLQQRPHIVYGGKIEKLRSDLAGRLKWAIEEVRLRNLEDGGFYKLNVSLAGFPILPDESKDLTEFTYNVDPKWSKGHLEFQVLNEGPEQSHPITHIYLLVEEKSPVKVVPDPNAIIYTMPSVTTLSAMRTSDPDKKKLGFYSQYRIPATLSSIPLGAVEPLGVYIGLTAPLTKSTTSKLALRFHTPEGHLDFQFKLSFVVPQDVKPAKPSASPV